LYCVFTGFISCQLLFKWLKCGLGRHKIKVGFESGIRKQNSLFLKNR
jgi:hypothetical protein